MDAAGYKYIEKSPFAFEFHTSYGAAYLVYFLPANIYFPPHSSLSNFIFSIDINLLYPGPYNHYDFVVSITMAEIVLGFFAADERRIIFYICDPSDGKQKARKRKFDYWFTLFNTGDYRKIDALITTKAVSLNLIFLALKTNPRADDLPLLIEEAKDKFEDK